VILTELAPYYRWQNGDHSIDFLTGVVYSNVETDAKLSRLPREISVSEDWVDPFIGIRWRWPFTEEWTSIVKGFIEGFGGSSEVLWEGFALLTWQPWKHAQILLGYRAAVIDYETGSGLSRFAYDVTLSGPIAGINFRW